MTELLSKLGDDPLVYAQKLNPVDDTVLLVELAAEVLHEHSFLDDRIFHPDMPFEWVPWKALEEAAATLPDRAPGYLFHIGHCGSTLISRLVAEASGTQALREPLPLRFLALNRVEVMADYLDASETARRLAILERSWARGAAATTVKATSLCTNLIATVNSVSPLAFIWQSAETHLAVILAGENAMQDLAGFGRNRYARLAALTDGLPNIEDMSIGELAGMTWLAEIATAQHELGKRDALRIDFDAFLADPASTLAKVCTGLGLDTSEERCDATVVGPIMGSYSKAPEYKYGAGLRAEIIADSKQRNAQELEKGMRLVERFRSSTCGAGWS